MVECFCFDKQIYAHKKDSGSGVAIINNTALLAQYHNSNTLVMIIFLQATKTKKAKAIKIVDPIVDPSTGKVLLPHKSTTPPQTVPTAITFNWTRCKDIPRGMTVNDQPVGYQRESVHEWLE